MKSNPRVFISYSHKDKDFVTRLETDFEARGVAVWLDVKSIEVGESISQAVETNLTIADFVCLVLSSNSISRPWVQREYRAALTLQLASEKASPRILPVLIDELELPPLLRDIRYADFRTNYFSALQELCAALGVSHVPAPFVGVFEAIGSDRSDYRETTRKAIENQDVLLLSRLWRAVVSGTGQLESELDSLDADRALRLTTETADHFINDRNNRIGLIQLPTIHMVENFNLTLPRDFSCEYWIGMQGVPDLVEALGLFRDEVVKRKVYLVPESVSWNESWSHSAEPRVQKDFTQILEKIARRRKGDILNFWA